MCLEDVSPYMEWLVGEGRSTLNLIVCLEDVSPYMEWLVGEGSITVNPDCMFRGR